MEKKKKEKTQDSLKTTDYMNPPPLPSNVSQVPVGVLLPDHATGIPRAFGWVKQRQSQTKSNTPFFFLKAVTVYRKLLGCLAPVIAVPHSGTYGRQHKVIPGHMQKGTEPLSLKCIHISLCLE